MKEVITMRSVQLTDEDIAFCISAICTKLLERPVSCRAYCAVDEYWGAISNDQKFTMKELLELLAAINADVQTIRDTLPTDSCESNSLGIDLSRGLLKLALGTDWVWEHILDYGLILIGLPTPDFRIPTVPGDIPSIELQSDTGKRGALPVQPLE